MNDNDYFSRANVSPYQIDFYEKTRRRHVKLEALLKQCLTRNETVIEKIASDRQCVESKRDEYYGQKTFESVGTTKLEHTDPANEF